MDVVVTYSCRRNGAELAQIDATHATSICRRRFPPGERYTAGDRVRFKTVLEVEVARSCPATRATLLGANLQYFMATPPTQRSHGAGRR